MSCLSKVDVQAMVDGEAGTGIRLHVAECRACAARVHEQAQRQSTLLASVPGADGMPAHVVRRVEAALVASRATGATRLRAGRGPARHRAFWSGALLTAATLAGVLVVAPMWQAPSTVSAAEILAASASRLQAPVTGIEVLEYELRIDGLPRELMPDDAGGSYRVWKAIDHDHPGRFRFASFDTAGRPISSIAQDPALNRRVMLMLVDQVAYRFETTLPAGTGLSVPELERLHLEATIGMMQAHGDQLLQVADAPDGREYRIEVRPDGAVATANPVWDLASARVVIKADDYRITEFAATGTMLGKPYSVSFMLIHRTVGAALPPDAFEVPAQPGQIALSGEGSMLPARDAMLLAFREINRLTQAR